MTNFLDDEILRRNLYVSYMDLHNNIIYEKCKPISYGSSLISLVEKSNVKVIVSKLAIFFTNIWSQPDQFDGQGHCAR